MAEARLKPGGVILIVGFAAAIVALGVYSTQLAKKPQQPAGPGTPVTPSGPTPTTPTTPAGGEAAPTGEAPIKLMTNEVQEVARQAIPQVIAQGKYVWDEAKPTVVFPINIWAGWGPIIAANDGFAPGSERSVFKQFGFDVELRLIDDPGQAANAYASGQAHTMWGTLDMIALFAPQMAKVGLTPKVFQQVDWSRGGDGIVARSSIRTVADLKGKTIALCQNSPSHYYLLVLLEKVGLTAKDVNLRFTSTAFGASALYAQDRTVHACVSWAPDIYTLVDPKNNPGGRSRLLSTTADAANVIADVWAVRPDFAAEHPKVVEGLVRGIFMGWQRLKEDPDRVAALMAQGFGVPVEDCKSMQHDAYPTGMGDNERFFLDAAWDASFSATWKQATALYREYGAIEGVPVAADQVLDASIIRKLKEENAFSDQTVQHQSFKPMDVNELKENIESSLPEVLRKPVHVQFKPNSAELDEQFDPTIPATLAEIKKLADQFGAARIIIEGNTDTSRKNEFRRMGPRVFAEMSEEVQRLSERRANSMRDAVLKLMGAGTDPNKIVAFGNGWENPLDPVDHAKNRRVDVRVLSVE